MQQAALIMSFIPATSPIYRDLAMLDTLEDLFHYANLCSTTTMTRTEILAKIDAWTLDTKSYATLNESLAALRTYYADLSGKGNKVNKVELYQKVLQRVKKERGIPSFVHRMLDESNLKIERETNTGEMLELVLAPLKYLLSQKKPALPVTHQVELDNLDPLGAPLDPPNPTFISDSGLKNDSKQNGHSKNGNGSKKKKGNGNGNKSGNKQQNQQKRAPVTYVSQWPDGKKYLTSRGALTFEVESHFKHHCYKCGMSNHNAAQCRIYPQKNVVLTLCSTCRAGFHTVCKNYRYLNQLLDKQDGKAPVSGNDGSAAATDGSTHANQVSGVGGGTHHHHIYIGHNAPLPITGPPTQPALKHKGGKNGTTSGTMTTDTDED
jgi:DNA-binding protein Fis